MVALLTSWLAKVWYERLIDIGILLSTLWLLGYSALQFLRTLKRDKIKLTLTKDSISTSDGESPTIEESGTPGFWTTLIEKREENIRELEALNRQLQEDILQLQGSLDKMCVEESLKRDREIPSIQHPLFQNLKGFMERGVDISPPTKAWSEEKKIIGKTFLEDCVIEVFHRRFKEFVGKVEEAGTDDDSRTELYSAVDLIYACIAEYNLKAKSLEIILPNGKLYGVPSCYLTKFDAWHSSHLSIIITKVQATLNSDFYGNWRTKLNLILDHMDTAFLLTTLDAERTLGELNGDLEKEIEKKIVPISS